MTFNIQETADIAEYASMYAIPFDAAVGVYCLVGAAGLRRIITRKAAQ
jgi:hypothetical protein